MFRGMFVRAVHWTAQLCHFWSLRNMQNVPQCTALLHCSGNVPHKFVPVHIPVPVSASLTHSRQHAPMKSAAAAVVSVRCRVCRCHRAPHRVRTPPLFCACMHGRPTVWVSSAAGTVRAVGACHQLYQPLHQPIALELRKNSYGFGAMARTDREPMWRPS